MNTKQNETKQTKEAISQQQTKQNYIELNQLQ